MKKIAHILLFLFCSIYCFAQSVMTTAVGGEYVYENSEPCLSVAEHSAIATRLYENAARLRAEGVLPDVDDRRLLLTTFDWPLRQKSALGYNSYYGISNFVDQNPNTGLLDYNCDDRTYDGHNGIDISTWPFPWYIYDNDLVEIIAGAAGVIIGKDDGQDDDHCSCSGTWNAVYIQHADGSIAWYGHLKNNSLTNKAVGASVVAGEYLGVLASSGCSTGPHLHFEVYESTPYIDANLIDPFSGACNSNNTQSWWADQKANREPTINAVLTHSAPPLHGCPGVDEVPNFDNSFTPDDEIFTAFYFHDQIAGSTCDFRLIEPDNTVYSTWDMVFDDTYSFSWWYWSWYLPTNGSFGTWKLEASYQGETVTHYFNYSSGSCEPPTNPMATVISGNVVKIEWTSAIDAERYRVRYRPVGGTWTERLTAGMETFRFLNELTVNTTYECQLKTNCTASNSVWSSSFSFTTTNDVCNFPITTSVSNISATSASPYWGSYPDDEKYKIKYKNNNGGSATTVTVNATQYQINNLSSNTSYNYRLKTKCPNGWTNWSGKNYFTTTNSINEEPYLTRKSDASGILLYPNPATNVLNIESSIAFSSIQICDIHGRIVSLSEKSSKAIDLSSLSSGVYWIRLLSDDGDIIKRFIKQ